MPWRPRWASWRTHSAEPHDGVTPTDEFSPEATPDLGRVHARARPAVERVWRCKRVALPFHPGDLAPPVPEVGALRRAFP